MNQLKKLFAVAALTACVLPVAAQYPVIPDSVKIRGEEQQKEIDRKSDEAWAKALPVVMSEAAQGRPYKPWASKPEDLIKSNIPAFPGAEGGGVYTPGGRGGKVTSLGVPDASIRLKDMAKATASMVTKCIDAYVKQDLKLAREVIDSDDIVDDLFDEVKDEILQGMRKGITTDVQSLDYLMIAKYYERIGDHATNIAEWVVYSINGHHKGE